jgi:hypothetical protein
VRGLGPPPQPAAELQARELRQHPVEEDQVGRPLLDHGDRLLAVERLGDVEARRLQVVGEQLLERRLVLDDQDERLHHPSSSCRGRLISAPWIM